MPVSHPSGRPRPSGPRPSPVRTTTLRAALCGLAAVLGASLAAGCAAPASRPGPSIKLSSAQVTQPSKSGVTDVYVDVQNTGPADELIGARISVGGHVTLRSPGRAGAMDMHTVSAITIPARSFVGLDPNGSHLLVTGAGKMISGREITLTLLFAHAGPISVPAMVTNPATGGSSYFLN
jgi:copper(I)-binding protein